MLTGEPPMNRLYEVVSVKDASHEVVSLTNRDVS